MEHEQCVEARGEDPARPPLTLGRGPTRRPTRAARMRQW
jgi:hypothetical protein